MTPAQIAKAKEEGMEIGFALLRPGGRTIRIVAGLTPPRGGWLQWLAGRPMANVDDMIPDFPDPPAGTQHFRWE